MSRPRHIDWKLVPKAQAIVAKTTDIRQLKAAQAVLLPACTALPWNRRPPCWGSDGPRCTACNNNFARVWRLLRCPERNGADACRADSTHGARNASSSSQLSNPRRRLMFQDEAPAPLRPYWGQAHPANTVQLLGWGGSQLRLQVCYPAEP